MNRLALSFFGFVLLAGTCFAQRTIDEIVVRVNNDVILRSELEQQRALAREELAQQFEGAELEAAVTQAEPTALRDLIDRSLLLQKGEELGIRTDLEVIRTMEQMRQEFDFDALEDLEAAIAGQGTDVEFFKDTIRTQYVTQQVIQREVYPKILLTTEIQRTYYDEHLEEFDRPEGNRIQEIVFNIAGLTPEQIEEVRSQAEAARTRIEDEAEDFGVVAAEVSVAPSRPNGGDLGYFATGALREDYEEIISQLGRGDVSEVRELSDELVILKLQDRHSGGILSFELARQEIEGLIFSQQLDGQVRDYLTELRTTGFVSVGEGYTDSGAAP
jgi:peptidyl-prolyl cis-trans isomerase SurA